MYQNVRFEHFASGKRYDSRITSPAHHCVRLPATGLTISEDCAVDTVHHTLHNRLAHIAV